MYRMVQSNIGAVLVVEKERPVGIITERDVLERAIMNKNVYKTTAKEVMSHPVISTEANCSVREALRLMRKHKIRRLAVTENETLVGLVTERRLLAEFASHLY
jgi:CBS domain-containing protein